MSNAVTVIATVRPEKDNGATKPNFCNCGAQFASSYSEVQPCQGEPVVEDTQLSLPNRQSNFKVVTPYLTNSCVPPAAAPVQRPTQPETRKQSTHEAHPQQQWWEHAYINPLKTKRICFIQGLSAYRAVNTLHFGYKNQSLNVL
jgi:hypothetical protein